MKYLFVVAHPDDELLGGGATITKLLEEGNEVSVCFMNNEDETRYIGNKKGFESDIKKSVGFMKYSNFYEGNFPNLRFNNVDHYLLVAFIESVIADCSPDVVITHHPDDVNDDHVHTSKACQVAFRHGQRMRYGTNTVSELYYMEVKSATDWTVPEKFAPNTFVGVTRKQIDKKIKALELYENVVRDHPHPRSERAIKALAEYRGSQSGYEYAEAFQMVFKRGM